MQTIGAIFLAQGQSQGIKCHTEAVMKEILTLLYYKRPTLSETCLWTLNNIDHAKSAEILNLAMQSQKNKSIDFKMEIVQYAEGL